MTRCTARSNAARLWTPPADGSTRRRAAGTGTGTGDLVRNRDTVGHVQKSNGVAETGAWLLENGHRLALALTGGRYPRTREWLTLRVHTVRPQIR